MHLQTARKSAVNRTRMQGDPASRSRCGDRRPDRSASRLLIALCSAIATTAVGCVDPDVRFIAFGDSATAGATAPAYPELLRLRLGEAEGTFINEGDDGENSEEGVERLDDLFSGGVFSRAPYPNAKALLYWEGGIDIVEFIRRHDPLFILCPDDVNFPFTGALNAALDATQANIEDAIQLGRDAELTVFVATYFAIPETIIRCDALLLNVILPAQAKCSNVYVEKLNDRIRAAAAHGAILVDVATKNAVMQADLANYVDCNHLSPQGNDIVAELFADAITASGI